MIVGWPDFLEARIAEDESEAAERAGMELCDGGWSDEHVHRILANCAAKRAIVRLYSECLREGYANASAYLGDAVHALATAYSNHADYREDWAPRG